MTPAQRALILAALGLTPRDGAMPRWSSRNEGYCAIARTKAPEIVEKDWVRADWISHAGFYFTVTRLGAEAAGVLRRCRRKDVSR